MANYSYPVLGKKLPVQRGWNDTEQVYQGATQSRHGYELSKSSDHWKSVDLQKKDFRNFNSDYGLRRVENREHENYNRNKMGSYRGDSPYTQGSSSGNALDISFYEKGSKSNFTNPGRGNIDEEPIIIKDEEDIPRVEDYRSAALQTSKSQYIPYYKNENPASYNQVSSEMFGRDGKSNYHRDFEHVSGRSPGRTYSDVSTYKRNIDDYDRFSEREEIEERYNMPAKKSKEDIKQMLIDAGNESVAKYKMENSIHSLGVSASNNASNFSGITHYPSIHSSKLGHCSTQPQNLVSHAASTPFNPLNLNLGMTSAFNPMQPQLHAGPIIPQQRFMRHPLLKDVMIPIPNIGQPNIAPLAQLSTPKQIVPPNPGLIYVPGFPQVGSKISQLKPVQPVTNKTEPEIADKKPNDDENDDVNQPRPFTPNPKKPWFDNECHIMCRRRRRIIRRFYKYQKANKAKEAEEEMEKLKQLNNNEYVPLFKNKKKAYKQSLDDKGDIDNIVTYAINCMVDKVVHNIKQERKTKAKGNLSKGNENKEELEGASEHVVAVGDNYETADDIELLDEDGLSVCIDVAFGVAKMAKQLAEEKSNN